MSSKTRGILSLVLLGFSFSSVLPGFSATILPLKSFSQEREAQDIAGLWRGTCEMRSGTIIFGPLFSLNLLQTNKVVTGDGEMSYGVGDEQGIARFSLNGTVNGSSLAIRTTDYQLIKRYTGRKSEAGFFEACSQFTFSLTLQKGRVDRALLSNYRATENPQPTDLVGDLLFGSLLSEGRRCVATAAFGLIRQPEVIVVMFGGAKDADAGPIPGTHYVQDGVYFRYLSEMKAKRRANQRVKYFQHRADGLARNFIVEQLQTSPQARIALVGHSLGGRATFTLADRLQRELPEVRIDLVVTLDPVTQHEIDPREGGRPGRGRPPLSWVAKIPPRPANINEWVNVYVDVSTHSTAAKLGGTQWGKQPTADVNLFWPGEHKEAGNMFNNTINGLCPAEKVKALSGLSPESRRLITQSTGLPTQANEASSGEVNRSRPGRTGTDRQTSTSAGASRNSTTYKVETRLLTNVTLRKGEKVQIKAKGIVRLGAFAGSSTPDGIDGFELYSYSPGAPHGALLVRITQNGNGGWTICGSECSFAAEGNGRLELLVNDRDASNNTGFYSVSVRRQ